MTPTLTLRLRAKTYFSEGGPRIISASSAESRQSLIAKLETTLRQSITLLLVTHVTYAASSAKHAMALSAIGQGIMHQDAKICTCHYFEKTLATVQKAELLLADSLN